MFNNTQAADKFRAASVALEAAEKTTNPFTAQMWRNHAGALLRQGRDLYTRPVR